MTDLSTRTRQKKPMDDDASLAATRQVLEFVRRNRRAHRSPGSVAYVAYVLAVIFGVYVLPYSGALIRLSGPHRGAPVAAAVGAALPTALPTLLLGVVLLIVRDALWRGPVSPAAAPVDWLLPAPLSRRLLLGRAYTGSVLAATLGLALLGMLPAIGIYACGVGSLAALLPSGAAAGALTGATGTGLALAVQRWGRPGRTSTAWTLAAVALLVTGCTAAAIAAVHHDPGPLAPVLPWVGPWGWAAQPVLAAAQRNPSAGQPAGWPLAAVLAVLCAVAGLLGRRVAHTVDVNELRRRSRAAANAISAVTTANFRQARLSRQPAIAPLGRRIRLPMPRSAGAARWTIPRRDAESLLRYPARTGTAALAVAAGAGLLSWAMAAAHDARVVLLVAAWTAFYLAAAQLVETARLEADDPSRAAGLGPDFGSVAVAHSVVPAVLLAALGAVAAAIGTSFAHAPFLLWLLPAAAVQTVAAALISAYRGPLPFGLSVGMPTPMGDTGALQMAFWYLRGTVLLLITLTLATVWVIHAPSSGNALVFDACFSLLLASLALRWVRSLATRLRPT